MRLGFYSADHLKPLYGRRRVRRLCEHIDLLERLMDRAYRERDETRADRDRLRKACEHVAKHCYCQPSGQSCDVCHPAVLALAGIDVPARQSA